jgi:hypothetical protein
MAALPIGYFTAIAIVYLASHRTPASKSSKYR